MRFHVPAPIREGWSQLRDPDPDLSVLTPAVLSMFSSWLFLRPIHVHFDPSLRTLVFNKQREMSLANSCKGEFTQGYKHIRRLMRTSYERAWKRREVGAPGTQTRNTVSSMVLLQHHHRSGLDSTPFSSLFPFFLSLSSLTLPFFFFLSLSFH